MEDFDRINLTDDLMSGQACIRNSHIPVSMIVSMMARGVQIDEILTEFPFLEFEDIRQALEYAAWLAHKRVYPHRN